MEILQSIQISMLHSDVGGNWAMYLKKLLLKDERQSLQVNMFEIEDADSPCVMILKPSLVIILLLTPDMVDLFTGSCQLGSWLDDYVTALPAHCYLVNILAFIEQDEYHGIQKYFKSASRWNQMRLSESVQSHVPLVAEIIDIVEKAEKAEKAPKPKKRATLEEASKTLPSETKASSMEVNKASQLTNAPQVLDIVPSQVFTAREKVVIIFNQEIKGTVQVGFTGYNKYIDTKPLNPTTYKFRTPFPVPNTNTLQVYHNGTLLTSKPFSFVKPNKASFQSLMYLMEVLGVDDKDELDQKLCDMFDRSMPADCSFKTLFSGPAISSSVDDTHDTACDYPTLLHYAAAHGLAEFTSLLLDLPASLTAFNILNQHGHNPADMAAANKHDGLAQYIRDFTDTNAVVDACGTYVSMMNSNNRESDMYIDMATSQTYTEPIKHRNLSSNPRPVKLSPRYGQHKTRKFSLDSNAPETIPPQLPPRSADCINNKFSYQRPKTKTASPSPNSMNIFNFEKNKSIKGLIECQSQRELIDLQQLVKSQEFTVDETIQLFNAWKERPESQSYRDRKRNLEGLKDKISKKYKDPKVGSLLKRLLSHRKNSREKIPIKVPISDPIYDTYPIDSYYYQNRGSGSSTDSNSLNYIREIVNSDSEEDRPPPVVPRKTSLIKDETAPPILPRKTKEPLDRRMSRKDMYLELSIHANKDDEVPPLPPRKKSTHPNLSIVSS